METQPNKKQREEALFQALDEQIMMLEVEVRRRISNIRKVQEEILKDSNEFWNEVHHE